MSRYVLSYKRRAVLALCLIVLAATQSKSVVVESRHGNIQAAHSPSSSTSSKDGRIFHNAALHPAADPFTFYDAMSGEALGSLLLENAKTEVRSTRLLEFPILSRHAGYYYAFSTEGMDPGYLFAIYQSPDLSTWERIPGGAMKACTQAGNNTSIGDGQVCWARDWQWAPECYHNPKTGWYFLFFTGRLRDDLTNDAFRFSAFEEVCK